MMYYKSSREYVADIHEYFKYHRGYKMRVYSKLFPSSGVRAKLIETYYEHEEGLCILEFNYEGHSIAIPIVATEEVDRHGKPVLKINNEEHPFDVVEECIQRYLRVKIEDIRSSKLSLKFKWE